MRHLGFGVGGRKLLGVEQKRLNTIVPSRNRLQSIVDRGLVGHVTPRQQGKPTEQAHTSESVTFARLMIVAVTRQELSSYGGIALSIR